MIKPYKTLFCLTYPLFAVQEGGPMWQSNGWCSICGGIWSRLYDSYPCPHDLMDIFFPYGSFGSHTNQMPRYAKTCQDMPRYAKIPLGVYIFWQPVFPRRFRCVGPEERQVWMEEVGIVRPVRFCGPHAGSGQHHGTVEVFIISWRKNICENAR